MTDFQNIELKIEQSVASIWLNRPERHNAFDAVMLNEIVLALSYLKEDENIRLLIIRGRGPSFCSGANLGWFADPLTMTFTESEAMASLMIQCFEAIYNFPAPVIAAVHGNVMGGGLGIMCAADIVMAEAQSVFAFPEVKTGLAPCTISPYVLRRLSPGKAKLFMFLAKKINLQEALHFGLIDLAINKEDFELQLTEIADMIRLVAPGAVNEIKLLINKLNDNQINGEVQNKTKESFTRLRNGEEFKEGMMAFYEKRKPNWIK